MPGVSHGVLDCLPSTQETQASEALAAVCAVLRGVLTGTAEGRCCVCVALRGPLCSCGCPTGACVDVPPPGHRCPTQSSDDVPSVSPWPWPCHGAPCCPLPCPSTLNLVQIGVYRWCGHAGPSPRGGLCWPLALLLPSASGPAGALGGRLASPAGAPARMSEDVSLRCECHQVIRRFLSC